ncbi:hypothetical protein DNL40_04195 [Xylanimonas oleitrophica]|uniref:Uncharacterized protein n=1 Tax=Xylanimonas oleitrophica TaxID=2607479 RepID=A0A2W5WU44_9MICO|nr:hypothetical protein [Xylanimonas oleitrophica]PZR54143.1 hypothetical protein DNL40_04195 [Xylanimonas oleitrophica]
MATRLLLEGDDLAELMAHVRGELGPRARVVRAERVRTGGFAGFFARERYEVTVDVPDDVPLPEQPAPPRHLPPGSLRPRSFEELIGAADAADTVTGAARPAAAGGAPGAAPGGVPGGVAAGFDGSVPAGAPGDADVPGLDRAPVPTPSTTGEDFATLLEQVRGMAGLQPEADVVVPPPPSGFTPIEAPVVDSSAVRTLGDRDPAGPAGDLASHLAALGVPAELLEPPVTFSGVLGRLPGAVMPLRTAGAVIVVVGPGADALATAALLADRCGVPETGRAHCGDVPVIVPTAGVGRRLGTAPDVTAWRAGAERAPYPGVLAVCLDAHAREHTEAVALLRAAHARQVWAAVDAHESLTDTRAWLDELGGARTVDALALRGALTAVRPAAALALPVPVGWIDGVPATRVAWAALLSAALDDPVLWS